MRKRLRRVGQWLRALLLLPFRLVVQFIRKPWHPFVVAGSWIGLRLAAVALGMWRLLGRMGLALRNLLDWFIWQPFLFTTSPFRWFYRISLRPFLVPFWRWLKRGFKRRMAPVRRRWQRTAPWRARRRRRLGSRWLLLRARMRVWLKRPRSPQTAVIAPAVPGDSSNSRRMRFATALISISIVLIVSLVTWQERQPDPVAANDQRFLVPRVVVTATPSGPTPTPVPTVEVVLTPWPTPNPLNDGGTVAFTLHKNGNSDIYILVIGQGDAIRLTSHPAADRDPVWSPDGRKIAFTSRRDGNWEVYIYDLSQGKLHRLTDNPGFDGGPTWSPDGQWLAYESGRSGNLDIFIVKADLSEGPFPITENSTPDYAPAWSPGDGRHIAFTSWRTGNKDIFIRSLDDLFDEEAVNVTQSPGAHEDDPAFSPDGRFLAYSQNRDGLDLVYALPLDGDYRAAAAPISLRQQGQHPVWSPNGKTLLYVHTAESQGQESRSYLMAGSPDAWAVAPQIFTVDGRLRNPSWSAVTLTPDLLAGLDDLDKLGDDYRLFVEAVSEPQPKGPPVLLQELPINAPSPYLSERVDQSFMALRERVIEETGWDFLGQLDNMFESLDNKGLPGQDARTWNKAGRAFDLPYREALSLEPRIEVVREDQGVDTYWRVYIKAEVQDGSQGEPLRQLPWDFAARQGDEPRYYEQGGKLRDAIPTGYYVDFTALAADYGWTRVPAGSRWRTYFPDIRFWHYENRQGLTWEEAMLEIYNESDLAEEP